MGRLVVSLEKTDKRLIVNFFVLRFAVKLHIRRLFDCLFLIYVD